MLLEDRELQSRAARIEAMLEEIEALPDPNARARMADIVQGLLELYGEGLARILAIVTKQPDPEERAQTLKRLTEDELISHLLLLHDLHPVDVETRVEQALEGVRPYLQTHGGNVALIGVEEGVAYLRLEGHCKGCPSSTMTLRHTVEEALRRAAPELIGIVAEEPPQMPANFVPLTSLMTPSS